MQRRVHAAASTIAALRAAFDEAENSSLQEVALASNAG